METCGMTGEHGVCEWGAEGAKVGKPCRGCSGEAVDELRGRREMGVL